MANMNTNPKQVRRHRRRGGGVPTALVVVLLVISILMGGLVGFAIARRTAPADSRLQQANERIIELENTLNLIGFPMDGDPNEWVFDDNAPQSDAASELAGMMESAEEVDNALWSDEGELLTGELKDDGDPVVVAEYDGGQVLSTEVIPEFNDQLSAQIFAGYSAEEVSESVLQSVLSNKVGEKLVAEKAKEQGLDALTDEDEKRIQAQAEETFKEQIEYYSAFVAKDGMTPQEIQTAAEAYMKETDGVTRESIVEKLRRQLPIQKYRESFTKDVTVTDEDVAAYYQDHLAEQKSSFDEYPEEYEYAHIDGATLLYNPAGYRRIRNLLLTFDDDEKGEQAMDLMEQIAKLDPQKNAEEIRALESQLEPLYKPLEDKAAEISEKLKAGEKFIDLMDQYGQDEMMHNEPLRTEGYYISDRSYLYSTEFVQGCMMLERPGQVSTTLRSASGLHMVEYAGDVTPGEVPLADVFEAVKAEVLEARKNAVYEQHVSELLDGAGVKYYPERLR